jgi:hypothetical protein
VQWVGAPRRALHVPCHNTWLPSGLQNTAAARSWHMLLEWREWSAAAQPLVDVGPSRPTSWDASALGAVVVGPTGHDADNVLAQLKPGWRPVLLQPGCPSIAHVPWLAALPDILAQLGVRFVQQDGQVVVEQVCCRYVQSWRLLLCLTCSCMSTGHCMPWPLGECSAASQDFVPSLYFSCVVHTSKLAGHLRRADPEPTRACQSALRLHGA